MSIYGNPITTSFLNRLPDAYQEVTYIENTDDAYINLPIYTSDIAGGEVKWLKYPYGTQFMHIFGWIFGGSSHQTSGQSAATVGVSTSSFQDFGGFGYTNYVAPIGCTADNVLYDLQFEIAPGSQTIVLNGVTTTGAIADVVQPTLISLFSMRFGSGVHAGESTLGRVYKFKLYGFSGDTLIDLVPCYRISDMVAGMFDRVSRTFYTNSGIGSFGVGNNVK